MVLLPGSVGLSCGVTQLCPTLSGNVATSLTPCVIPWGISFSAAVADAFTLSTTTGSITFGAEIGDPVVLGPQGTATFFSSAPLVPLVGSETSVFVGPLLGAGTPAVGVGLVTAAGVTRVVSTPAANATLCRISYLAVNVG